MGFLSKKESLKDAIPIIALFTALELILISLVAYFEVLILALFFILSFPSFILGCLIKNRYYLFYSLILFLLSLLTCMGNASVPFIYLLPSLVVAFLFSFAVKNKIDQYLILITTSLIYFFLEFLILKLFSILFSLNIIEYFLNIFKLSEFIYKDYLVYFTIYFYSFFSTFLSFIFIKANMKKIDKELEFISFNKLDFYLSIVSISIFLVLLILSFFTLTKPFSLILSLINLTSLIYLIYLDIKKDNYISLIIFLILLFIFIILIAFIPIKYLILVFSSIIVLEFLYFLIKNSFINKKYNLK